MGIKLRRVKTLRTWGAPGANAAMRFTREEMCGRDTAFTERTALLGGNMGKHKKVERMKEIGRRRKRREERLKLRIREAKAAAKAK